MSTPKIIAAALLFWASTATLECGAQMGIRSGLQHEKVTKSTSGSTLNLLLGWDFDFNGRLSGGLDFSTDMNWMDESGLAQYSTNLSYPNGPGYYTDKVKNFGIQYRSQFHFADNGGGSVYFGPTIGLRFIKQNITYNEETPFDNYAYWFREVKVTEKAMTVPLGARLGYRGPLDGGYVDLYFALGTNLGSSEPFSNLRFLAEESMPTTLFFQAGLGYGIGW